MKKTRKTVSPLTYASPWILAAAIGILIAMVFFFAANNLQREKRIMNENLQNKGQAIIRFIGAGTRASLMTGGQQNPQQLQQLIEQATEESSIIYIAITDKDGRIMAHSKPELVNTVLDHPLLSGPDSSPFGRSRITSGQQNGQKIFEIAAPFKPFMRGRSHFFKQFRQTWPSKRGIAETESSLPSQPGLCQTMPEMTKWAPGEDMSIVVGLDMSEQDKIIQQDRYQIISISIVMLLVAIGGWTTLLTAQSYKSSQHTLMNMQAFTDLLISRLPLGIIATDAQGHIRTYNSSAARLTGKEPAQALGHRQSEILPQLKQFLPLSDQGKEIMEGEVVLLSEGHTPNHLKVSSAPITDGQGRIIGRVMLLHDITETKKLEAQLRRNDRLVALGKMAAGVAHEVRNPLSSIKGFATLLGSRFSSASEEGQAANLLINEVERLNRSITELLTYTRPLPLALTDVDLKPFLEDSLKLIQSDAKELGVSVRQDISLTGKSIRVDRDRLNQVLLNLYLNSLQAMEHGGELEVSAREGGQPDTVEITVRDTGGGIAENILERVFDPYFTTKPEGTGLGLAMAARIVEEHGGTIRISSEAGKGTEITIVLPG